MVEKLDSSDTLGGNLDLDGSLLPDAAGGNAYFPNHVLAVIAEGDTYQRGQYVMAPVYSGGTFRIVKDNVLLGSVISNMFQAFIICSYHMQYERNPKNTQPHSIPDAGA